MRLLVDAGESSLDMARAHGNGVRIAEIAAALSAHHEVRLLAPELPTEPLDVGAAGIVAEDAAGKHLAWCDAVFFFDSPRPARLRAAVDSGRRIISECRPPIEMFDYPRIRQMDDPQPLLDEARKCYVDQIACSHFFINRSQVERLTTIGAMVAIGRITREDFAASRSLEHMMATVPIGFSSHSRDRAASIQAHHLADFLWTGGMWSFFLPDLFVRALAEVRCRGRPVTGAFLHTQPHPDTIDTIRSTRDLVRELGLDASVTFLADEIRHDDRDALIRGARGLVCLSSGGIENETTVRFRLRDTLLHQVPLIIDEGGGTAAAVAERRLGVVAANRTPAAVADAMELVLDADQPEMEAGGFGYEDSLAPVLRYLQETS